MKTFGIHHNALAYSMTTLGAGMMNSVFNFYYVKLFLNQYRISEGAFHQAQVIYMIWNALNDPLFGYIQDNSKVPCFSKRRYSILYGAPFYALAFLLPWFPWRTYQEGDWLSGVHLVIALCAFDGMLTFVLLAQCALFAEISTKHENRLQLITYNQVASLIGSTSILFCGLVSNNMESFLYFQAFTIGLAMLSTACMCYTGVYGFSQYEQREKVLESAGSDSSLDSQSSWSSVLSLTKQILTQKNFILFVIMNFFQVFHLTFCSNFMMIFADNLIPKEALPSFVRSFMYGAGFICPQSPSGLVTMVTYLGCVIGLIYICYPQLPKSFYEANRVVLKITFLKEDLKSHLSTANNPKQRGQPGPSYSLDSQIRLYRTKGIIAKRVSGVVLTIVDSDLLTVKMLVLSSHSLLKSFGYYKVIRFSFYIEAIAASIMYFLGPHHCYLLALFLTANMVIVHATFSLFNLPLADIVDADLAKYKRRSPLSSMVFGTNALFTKPAQSLAPMLVVMILNQFGYENLNTNGVHPDPSLFLGLHGAMFSLICLVPLCIAVLQIITWTPYSIRDSHTVSTH